jgi:hypothetical protein
MPASPLAELAASDGTPIKCRKFAKPAFRLIDRDKRSGPNLANAQATTLNLVIGRGSTGSVPRAKLRNRQSSLPRAVFGI